MFLGTDFQPIGLRIFLKATMVIAGASIPLVRSSEKITIVSLSRYFLIDGIPKNFKKRTKRTKWRIKWAPSTTVEQQSLSLFFPFMLFTRSISRPRLSSRSKKLSESFRCASLSWIYWASQSVTYNMYCILLYVYYVVSPKSSNLSECVKVSKVL